MKKQSPRQELADYVGRSELRDALERVSGGLSDEAIQLCVDIVSRYCEPRKKRKRFKN